MVLPFQLIAVLAIIQLYLVKNRRQEIFLTIIGFENQNFRVLLIIKVTTLAPSPAPCLISILFTPKFPFASLLIIICVCPYHLQYINIEFWNILPFLCYIWVGLRIMVGIILVSYRQLSFTINGSIMIHDNQLNLN